MQISLPSLDTGGNPGLRGAGMGYQHKSSAPLEALTNLCLPNVIPSPVGLPGERGTHPPCGQRQSTGNSNGPML